MIAVVLLQTKVWFEGGHGKTVLQFRNCVSESLQMAINCSVTANWTNVSIPVKNVFHVQLVLFPNWYDFSEYSGNTVTVQ